MRVYNSNASQNIRKIEEEKRIEEINRPYESSRTPEKASNVGGSIYDERKIQQEVSPIKQF